MEYKDIKQKYGTDAAVRNGRRRALQNNVNFAQSRVEAIEAQLERLRPQQGITTAEDAQEKERLLFQRNNAIQVLKQAKSELNDLEAEIIDMPTVVEMITH